MAKVTIQIDASTEKAIKELATLARSSNKSFGSIDKNINQIKKSTVGLGARFKQIGTTLAAVLGRDVILGTFRFLRNEIESTIDSVGSLGDEIAKTSRKLGVGVEALQELRFAAGRAGIAANTFDVALQRFTRRSAEAAQGTGEAKDALRELGVELRDASGNLRPAEELLGDVADGFAKIPSQARRVALAFKLFDTEGVALVNLLQEGRITLEQFRSEARRFGLVTAEQAAAAEAYADSVQDLQAALQGLRIQVGSAILKPLTKLIRAITDNRKAIVDLIRNGIDKLGDALIFATKLTVAFLAALAVRQVLEFATAVGVAAVSALRSFRVSTVQSTGSLTVFTAALKAAAGAVFTLRNAIRLIAGVAGLAVFVAIDALAERLIDVQKNTGGFDKALRAAAKVGVFFVGVIRLIVDVVEIAVSQVTNLISSILRFKIVQKVLATIARALALITKAFLGFTKSLANSRIGSRVLKKLGLDIGEVNEGLDDAAKSAQEFADEVSADTFKELGENLTRGVRDAGKAIDKELADIQNQLKELGDRPVKLKVQTDEIKADVDLGAKGFANSIKEGLDFVNATLGKVGLSVDTIVNAFKQGGEQGAKALVVAVGDFFIPGLGPVLDFLAQGVEQVRFQIVSVLENIPDIIFTILETILELPFILLEGAVRFIERLIERLPEFIQKFIVGIVTNAPKFVIAIVKAIPRLITALVEAIPEIVTAFIDAFLEIIASGEFIAKLAESIGKAIGKAFEGIPSAVGDIGGGILGGVGDVFGGVGDFIGGIFEQGGTVPSDSRFFNDRGVIGVSGGEEVLDRATAEKLTDFLNEQAQGGGGGGQNVTVNLMLNEQTLAETILNLNRKGFRLS